MEIFKDKKVKNIIIICITLVTLLELYFAYRVAIEYAGVYQVGIFYPFIVQPFSYNALLRKQISYFKLRIVVLVLISLILPSIIYFTLPEYTYNEGKKIVERHVQSSQNIEFVDIAKDKVTLPITGNPKGLFVNDKAYYYEVKLTSDKEYFMVNPISGDVMQLSEENVRSFHNISKEEDVTIVKGISYDAVLEKGLQDQGSSLRDILHEKTIGENRMLFFTAHKALGIAYMSKDKERWTYSRITNLYDFESSAPVPTYMAGGTEFETPDGIKYFLAMGKIFDPSITKITLSNDSIEAIIKEKDGNIFWFKLLDNKDLNENIRAYDKNNKQVN